MLRTSLRRSPSSAPAHTAARVATLALGFAIVAGGVWAGCGSDTSVVPGGTGAGATGGSGTAGAGAGQGGEGLIIVTGGSGGVGGQTSSCDPPCADDQICSHGVCVPLEPCDGPEDCQNDTTCDPEHGCVPWEEQSPGYDETCLQLIEPGVLQPDVQCEFSSAAPGDPFPNHVDVQGTPIVVNFHQPLDSGPPSILASFTAIVPGSYTENLGVIRVLRGTDCGVEAVLGGTDLDGDGVVDWTVSPSPLAAGDLDGDGVPEVVAYSSAGPTLAFTRKLVNWSHEWRLLWKAPFPVGNPGYNWNSGWWAGPSIHDLDDDGSPEVIREGIVFGADGALRSTSPPGYTSYSAGLMSVLANLDLDPAIEFTNGQYIWEWHYDSQSTSWGWMLESYFPGATASAPGHVAIADFGAYGATNPAQAPELAVVRGGYAMIYATSGELAMAAIPIPGGGGGPPTISDFDGDGLPELAVAGADYYTLFDIDCGPTPRPTGTCPSGTCDHLASPCPAGSSLAWSRRTQDHSSNITGSSIFDFEADGSAEAVYADECFVRVYKGSTGEVLFSQYRSSCTWYENPIIADVDGDFRAELVTPSNKACSDGVNGIACGMLDAYGMDSQFAGLRCEEPGDCVSGVCDAGLCRCTGGAECCGLGDAAACLEQGYGCAPPPAGTPGTGNTCRAAHPRGVSGIRVYQDANDKWVRSRMIWNQNPYAVTHVEENGAIPRSSLWLNNWEQPELNNFRQNVPGQQNGAALGDATAGAAVGHNCSGQDAILEVAICNRGATAVPPNIDVGFYAEGDLVCSTATSHALEPEQCETVTCIWPDPPTSYGEAVDVEVVADDGQGVTECQEANNHGVVLGVFCQPPA